jgi:hypothetical protein
MAAIKKALGMAVMEFVPCRGDVNMIEFLGSWQARQSEARTPVR